MIDPTVSPYGRYQPTRWDVAADIIASVRPSLWGLLAATVVLWGAL